ncbi:MAG: GntR family transcriptional regulator [Variovorax sp.]
MEYRTKEEQVADFLREGIISGKYPRGSRLKQAELAEQLRLSITPVREALKLLAAEGYVDGDSYKGSRVAQFDPAASAETLNLRMILESQLVRAAVDRMTASDLDAIRVLSDEFEAAIVAGDRSGARGVNYRLHRRLYAIANLPQTLHFVQILWAKYPFDLINAEPGRGEHAVEEHKEILTALVNGDATTAMLAMRRHIESGWAVVKGD